ncbi:protein ENHANCED DOWNY MILDEW 2-like isoform X3 [Diospyros lotus]|uniref:protein ENHANCED DOWNY MILDEW 2-like isoform X3 n=1 Tax=Diospyros lotus TaxID=55363 RepID=UPI0022585164|nr:protein ENHANCED DOWNY MILDEW 2-like isoform X3 [Diospyros lotus]
MASSDEEGGVVPRTVSNYHFVDDKEEIIAFSELPVRWSESEELQGKRRQMFLHGTTDNGLQKIYKQVTAWKFNLSDFKPEISVLSKENNWIKLQKPRKSFEDTIRTILITVNCLHFLKKNPDSSGRSLWDHLSKVFSSYEVRPSENDLIDHMSLISEAVKRDEMLAKSKVNAFIQFLITYLEEKPRRKKASDEDIGPTPMAKFIVDDDMADPTEDDDGSHEDASEDDDGSHEERDLFDSVCSICDNGGELLCCEGRCMRSFHATVEAGSDSACESLGFSDEQVEAIQSFFCQNCQYKQHQCFACGELGSSDKLSGAEVFQCVSATCGRFYHPHCVAKLLHRENPAEAEVLQKKIVAGESFACPIHKCIVCKQGENKEDAEFQFAVCRRCPKSYHKKCLPREIAFEDHEDEDIIQRAWEDLIPDRILIYCLEHEIDDEIGTPIRNHIKFPYDGQKKKKQKSQQSLEKVLQKDRSLLPEDIPRKRGLVKLQKGVDSSPTTEVGDSSNTKLKRLTGSNSSKKQKLVDATRKPLNNIASKKVFKSTKDESRTSLGDRLFALINSRNEDASDIENKQTSTGKPAAKEISTSLQLDDVSKKRILHLMKDATSSISLEAIMKGHKVPTTHSYSLKYMFEKLTLGKVEGSVEALRAALQKLEGGGSVEDARVVCEPRVLHQITRWKSKLKVYLAPFLYGMRYTSFGRHFTKVDKLKEIVDVLHFYVRDGDTIVDFCCGANDFSWLMKKKLDDTGKTCSFKNYDILQPKNDFNFEKRDWMTVDPKELPAGSQLIMGLNPPFGVNASLANKFIDRALKFKPKLLILIVPKETERLDKKRNPYDLLWEDDELLSGKSFYLPGSVDVNDNQMEDWNVNPPPVYLWSRPDWTDKHRTIAQKHGHLSKVRERSHSEDHNNQLLVSDCGVKDHDPKGQTSMSIDDHPPVQDEVCKQLQERARVSGGQDLRPSHDNGVRQVQENHSLGANQLNVGLKKRQRGEGKGEHGIRLNEKSQKRKEKRRGSWMIETHEGMPHPSPSEVTGSPLKGKSVDVRSSKPLEISSHKEDSRSGDHSSKRVEVSSHKEVAKEQNQRFDKSVAGSRSHYETAGYGGVQGDDLARRYGLNSEEPYSGDDISRYGLNSEEPYSGSDIARRYGLNSEKPYSGSDIARRYGLNSEKPYSGDDDISRRYGLNSEVPYSGFTERWSRAVTPGSSFGVKNSEEQFASPQKGEASNHGYGYRSYLGEMEDRERSQVRLYGQQTPETYSRRSSFVAGQSLQLPGSTVDSSYNRTSTSAIQRYAPRLDELNHARMNTSGHEPPPAGRNLMVDPLPPPFSFAPAPYRHFSPHNSSGWLNE